MRSILSEALGRAHVCACGRFDTGYTSHSMLPLVVNLKIGMQHFKVHL